MKKKLYINPFTDVLKIEASHVICQFSDPAFNDPTPPGGAPGRVGTINMGALY